MKAFGKVLPLLFAGFLLGSEANADPRPNKRFLITLEMTDQKMRLDYTNSDGMHRSYSVGPLSNTSLFSSTPGFDRNLANARLLLHLLHDRGQERTEEDTNHSKSDVYHIRRDLEAAKTKGEQIGLYIGAAGYDKALKARMSELEEKQDSTRTNAEALREDMTNGIGEDFADDIARAGCFNTENKAEFQGCVLTRILSTRLEHSFNPDKVVIEPESVYQNQLANLVRKSLKTSSHLYLLVSGNSANVMAKPGDSLLETPAWTRGKETSVSFAEMGGTHETGYLYTKEMVAAPYDRALVKAKTETPPGEMPKEKFLEEDSTDPLTRMLLAGMKYLAEKEGPFSTGKEELSPAQVLARLYIHRDSKTPELITGEDFEYVGQLVSFFSLMLDQPRAQEYFLEATGFSEETMKLALAEARGVVNRVGRSLQEVLILFAGLVGPSMTEGSEIVVIGEHRGFYAKNLNESLLQIMSDNNLFQTLFGHYQLLTKEDFAGFDALTPQPRDPAIHLVAGLDENGFRSWLEHFLATTGKIHQLTDYAYEGYVSQAMRSSYVTATSQ